MVRAKTINEAKSSGIVNMDKLKEVADAINTLDLDYGQTYFNEAENKIFVIVGDGCPFDIDLLEDSIKNQCAEYKHWDDLEVEIENEAGPPGGEGWKKIA